MIQGKHIIEPNEIKINGLNTEYIFKIKPHVYLEKVFDNIPSKSIINKGRCGIGGTFLEINANRNSIIIVPTNAVIDNKCFDENGNLKENHFVVRGKSKAFKFNLLREFMLNEQGDKKIFTTPESFLKIITCGFPVDRLYKEWFVLFDEAHTTITENYREGILNAYKYFFLFENSALISATPYSFSSPKFEAFTIYTIEFTKSETLIEIQSTQYIKSLLYTILKHPEDYPGRVHIFLNSVNQIGDSIRMSEITDCSIFCKDDNENMKKLNEVRGYFKNTPIEVNFSKFNFYTTKYFEGWDLSDANATIIIISDIHELTLSTGISNKCVQAAGRNRLKSNKIIHITNNRNDLVNVSFKMKYNEIKEDADSQIDNYNQHINEVPREDKAYRELLKRFSDLDKINNYKATINDFKIDQIVNKEMCYQEYNHLDFIEKAWQNANYKVVINSLFTPKIPEHNLRLKQSLKFKVTAEFLFELEKNDEKIFKHYKDVANLLPIQYESIRVMYYELGLSKMKELDYNPAKIQKTYIESVNLKLQPKIKEAYFKKMGHLPHTNSDIITLLQDLYAQYGLLDPTSKEPRPLKPRYVQLEKMFTKFLPTKIDGVMAYYVKIY